MSEKQSILHLFAHMDKNYVTKGERVSPRTVLGTIGTGNGQYYAHLHYSKSSGLSINELIGYIRGWSKSKVQKYYLNPLSTDFKKMFGREMDVGNLGYGYLQRINEYYGYHPGVDINGLGGGNSDFGYNFKSPVHGVVVFEKRTWGKNGGWGNVIIIKEDLPRCNHSCPLCCGH